MDELDQAKMCMEDYFVRRSKNKNVSVADSTFTCKVGRLARLAWLLPEYVDATMLPNLPNQQNETR